MKHTNSHSKRRASLKYALIFILMLAAAFIIMSIAAPNLVSAAITQTMEDVIGFFVIVFKL